MFETQEGMERCENYCEADQNILGQVIEKKKNKGKTLKLLGETLPLKGNWPEPSNIVWENLHIEPHTLMIRQVIIYSMITLILFAIFMMFA